MKMKPGYTGLPFFGVVPAVVDAEGNELKGEADGYLVLKTSWPGIARTIQSAHHLFVSTYFERFPGYYCTGDGELLMVILRKF
jgi:acetyl-CoA synthetase